MLRLIFIPLRLVFRLMLRVGYGLLLLVAMTAVHSQTEVARGAIREVLSILVSSAIVGDLEIDEIDEIGRDGLYASDVTLRDQDGNEVIFVRQLELRFGHYDSNSGLIIFPRADVRDGRITLRAQEDGLPTLVSALTPLPTTSGSSFLSRKISELTPQGAQISNIDLHQIQIGGELLGLSGIAGTAQEGTLHITAAKEIDVVFDHVRGTLIDPFGFDAKIGELSGSLSSRTSKMVDLHAMASRESEDADAHIFYGTSAPGLEPELQLDVTTSKLSMDTLTRLGYRFLSPFTSNVKGTLHLGGAPSELELNAQVQTEGGNVTVFAFLGEPLRAQIQSDALNLNKTVKGAPELTVSGVVSLTQQSQKPGVFVHAEMGSTTVAGLSIPSFQADGVLLDDAFVLEKVNARASGSRLHGSGRLSFDGPANFQVAAHFDDIRHDVNLRRLVPDASGSLDADLRLATPNLGEVPMDIQGELTSDNLRYSGLAASHLRAKVRMNGDFNQPTLSMQCEATGLALGAYIVGDGTMSLNGGPNEYAIDGEFTKGGSRNFALHGKVQTDKRGLTLSADNLELAVGKDTFRGSLSGLRVVEDESMRIDRLLLASRSQRLEASGALSKGGQDSFTAQLQNFELAAVSALVGPDFPLRDGRADATLEVTGDLKQPRLELQGLLRDVSALGMDDLQVLYLVSYDGNSIELDGELDMGDRGAVRVLGTGTATERTKDLEEALLTAQYTMELDAKNVDLSRLPWTSETIASGRLDTTIHAQGTRTAPQFDGTFAIRSLSSSELQPVNISGEVDYHDGYAQLQTTIDDELGPLLKSSTSAEITVASVLAGNLKGMEWPEVFALSAHLQPRESDKLPVWLAQKFPVVMTIDGDLSMARNHGPISATLDGHAVIVAPEDAPCAPLAKARINAHASVLDGNAEFNLTTYLLHHEILRAHGSALVPLDNLISGSPIELENLDFKGDLNISNIAQVPQLCELAMGSVKSHFEAQNVLSSNPTFSGDLQSKFFPPDIPRSSRGQIEIRSCGNDPAELKIDFKGHNKSGFVYGTLGGCGGGNARISGLAPLIWTEGMLVPAWNPAEEINFTVQFKDTQLRALLDRLPGIQTGEAIANGNLRISGLIDSLQYWGELKLSRGRVKIVGTGQTIEDVTSKITFKEHSAAIESFHGRAGEGTVDLKGGFDFVGLSPRHAQMAANLSNFPLRREGIKLAWLTGTAALESNFDDERSRTMVVIHKLDAQLPPQAPNTLQSLDPHSDVVVIEDKGMKPPPRPYVLDFQIRSDRPIVVRREDFEAAIHTELAVDYAEPNVRMAGYIEFRRGSFEVFGKKFNLVQGGLRFDGQRDLDPEVNLVATHTVPNTQDQVTVIARGHLSDPDIRFMSESCDGQAGALTLLVTGRCAEDPNSPTQASDTEGAFAAGLLQGVLTLGARRELGGLIPNLAVESGQRGYATRVRAGVESDSVIPKFMRRYVRKVYLQGAVSTAQTQTDTEVANQNASLDFMMQLYFPNNIVGAGHFAVNSWGMDLTWEP